MTDKLRAFVAIKLDPELKKTINSFEATVKNKAPSGLRWVKADLLHLTLKFLGDITPKEAEELSKILGQVVMNRPPFELQVAGTGAFPNWRNPRTLWVGINKNDKLMSLFQHLDFEIATLGFSPEGKPFTPHLTLCRVSESVDPRTVQPLQKEFEGFSTISLPTWKVNEVVLFKSQLQPGGPIYTPISKHTLK